MRRAEPEYCLGIMGGLSPAKVIDATYDAWARHDWDALRGYFHSNVEVTAFVSPEATLHGADAVIDAARRSTDTMFEITFDEGCVEEVANTFAIATGTVRFGRNGVVHTGRAAWAWLVEDGQIRWASRFDDRFQAMDAIREKAS